MTKHQDLLGLGMWWTCTRQSQASREHRFVQAVPLESELLFVSFQQGFEHLCLVHFLVLWQVLHDLANLVRKSMEGFRDHLQLGDRIGGGDACLMATVGGINSLPKRMKNSYKN